MKCVTGIYILRSFKELKTPTLLLRKSVARIFLTSMMKGQPFKTVVLPVIKLWVIESNGSFMCTRSAELGPVIPCLLLQ